MKQKHDYVAQRISEKLVVRRFQVSQIHVGGCIKTDKTIQNRTKKCLFVQNKQFVKNYEYQLTKRCLGGRLEGFFMVS